MANFEFVRVGNFVVIHIAAYIRSHEYVYSATDELLDRLYTKPSLEASIPFHALLSVQGASKISFIEHMAKVRLGTMAVKPTLLVQTLPPANLF